MQMVLTGATGFVGQNLLLKFLADDRYDVIWCPVRNPEKLKGQLGREGKWDPVRVRPLRASAAAWNLGAAAGAEHVVHCAGALFASSEEEFFEVNVAGTARLLHELRAPEKIVILSSQSATGPCAGQETKDESHPDRPITDYGRSKLAMEHTLAREFGHLNYLILCPPMILGARDTATLPLFRMVRSHLFFKPGFALKWFSYVAVEDLACAIERALAPDSDWRSLSRRRFFVGSDAPVSDRQLLAAAAAASRVRGLTLVLPIWLVSLMSFVVERVPRLRAAVPSLSADRAREMRPNRWVFSSAGFRREFNWRPEVSLAEVMAQTNAWYVSSGALPPRP